VKSKLGRSIPWLWLLGSQFLSAAAAAVVFQLGLDSRIAGFDRWVDVCSRRPSRHSNKLACEIRRAFRKHRLSHVFGSRFGDRSTHDRFSALKLEPAVFKVAVWGLSGPQFHDVSTRGVWLLGHFHGSGGI
jgi:hypothetical protein